MLVLFIKTNGFLYGGWSQNWPQINENLVPDPLVPFLLRPRIPIGALNPENDSFWWPHGIKSGRRQRAAPLTLQQLVPSQERMLIESSKHKHVSFAQ